MLAITARALNLPFPKRLIVNDTFIRFCPSSCPTMLSDPSQALEASATG